MLEKWFIKAVLHDVWRCTIPWLICRILMYPIVHIDMKLQRDYYTRDFEAFSDENAPVAKTFTFSQKVHYGRQIIAEEGILGLFERWENYVAPFAAIRMIEAIIYFSFMHLFVDVLNLTDRFFTLSLLCFFLLTVIGSLFSKVVEKIFSIQENEKIKLLLFDFKKLQFWKYYQIDRIYSHLYGHFQGFTLIIGFWYFKPNVILEMILVTLLKVTNILGSQRFGFLSANALALNFKCNKIIKAIYRKYGIWGLYSGSQHACAIEAGLSVAQIPLNYFIASIV